MKLGAVQWSAVQCSAVQCSAVQCSAVQCSAVQCSAVQCSAVQNTVQPNAVKYVYNRTVSSSSFQQTIYYWRHDPAKPHHNPVLLLHLLLPLLLVNPIITCSWCCSCICSCSCWTLRVSALDSAPTSAIAPTPAKSGDFGHRTKFSWICAIFSENSCFLTIFFFTYLFFEMHCLGFLAQFLVHWTG